MQEICYKTVDGQSLYADFMSPAPGPEPAPVLFFFHGGGWIAGTRKDASIFSPLFSDLQRRGYAIVNADYRLCKGAVHFPEILVDCRDAISFFCNGTRAYRLDPRRIVLGGVSAGAHLALTLALSLQDRLPTVHVCAVLDFCGPTELSALRAETNRPQLIRSCLRHLLSSNGAQEDHSFASPLCIVQNLPPGTNLPPVFAAHSIRDEIVPCRQTQLLAKEYVHRGGLIRTIYPRHTDHLFSPIPQDSPPDYTREELLTCAVEFLDLLMQNDR